MPEDQPSYKLYPLWGIAAAAAGGGLFAGALMIALNYRCLGKSEAAWQTIALGMAAGILVLTCFLYAGLPKSEILLWSIRLLQGVGSYYIAQKLQGHALKQHVQSGGKIASWWSVVGISILGILLLMLAGAICAVCSALLARK
jgi:hypothetical protein